MGAADTGHIGIAGRIVNCQGAIAAIIGAIVARGGEQGLSLGTRLYKKLLFRGDVGGGEIWLT